MLPNSMELAAYMSSLVFTEYNLFTHDPINYSKNPTEAKGVLSFKFSHARHIISVMGDD